MSNAKLTEQDRWERKAREYEAALTMLQDTGSSVWLTNAAYLVATTVLLGALVSLADKTIGTRPLFIGGGIAGMTLCLLWWGSFERIYAFYNFRIAYALSIEKDIGYELLTEGKKLSDGGCVSVEDRSFKQHFFGGLFAVQSWTRLLIALFFIMFAIILLRFPIP